MDKCYRHRKVLSVLAIVVLFLFLANEKKKQDNGLYFFGEGGSGSTGGMYDTMQAGNAVAPEAAMYGRGSDAAYGLKSMRAPISPPMPTGGTADYEEVVKDERMIVRTASLSAVVEDIRKAMDEVTVKVKEWQGFVTNSSINEYDSGPTAYLTLRVPVEQFDPLLAYFRSNYRVVSESISGDDVTEQYVDNEARLKALTASEEQFLSIMERATKIEDVLNVQQQLERVRAEIESLTAVQESLSRSAKLSTVSVSLSTEEDQLPIIDPSEKWSPLATFKDAIRNFRMMLIGIADLLIANSLYLAAAGICYVAYLLHKRIR